MWCAMSLALTGIASGIQLSAVLCVFLGPTILLSFLNHFLRGKCYVCGAFLLNFFLLKAVVTTLNLNCWYGGICKLSYASMFFYDPVVAYNSFISQGLTYEHSILGSTVFILLGISTYPNSSYGNCLRKWSLIFWCCCNSDCDFSPRCPDYWSDDAGDWCDKRDADAVSRVLGHWADCLPEDGGSSEQNRSPSRGEETKCHWEDDKENAEDLGKYQVSCW